MWGASSGGVGPSAEVATVHAGVESRQSPVAVPVTSLAPNLNSPNCAAMPPFKDDQIIVCSVDALLISSRANPV